jgi:hypothetical protein
MSLMILVLLISKLAAISRNWSLVYFRCRRLNLLLKGADNLFRSLADAKTYFNRIILGRCSSKTSRGGGSLDIDNSETEVDIVTS